MARKLAVLFVIQIILTTFVARNNQSETWNFQTSKYGPIEYCTSSTCVSSGARKIGLSFRKEWQRVG